MECRNEPLSTALGKLEKQTGFRIIFSHDDVSKHRVTVAIKQKTLREALHLLLDEKALSFQIEDKFITISPRGKRTDSLQEGKKPRFLVGQVLDEQRLPLPGAHISVQETQTVTSTLADGGFRVSVGRKEGWYTLHISYLGMVTQKQRIKVEAEQEEIQLPAIVLKEDNGILDEVVVTGYQVMSRRESASAITSIKAENILTPNAMSIDQMLQGQVPGMMVLSQSG
ncbi:MAG: carboxypeptidase-like regulatory domain-containing protein, partial [Bacteroides sp.]|nr:carboxypeptidase-like regulatory domain-containing protein [Bacteroides sp.]